MAYRPPVDKFADELDELVSRHQALPVDDRPSFAEIIAAMEFKKLNMMVNAREDFLETNKGGDDETDGGDEEGSCGHL